MTLNDVMAIILRYFAELGSFRKNYAKVVDFLPRNVIKYTN